MNRKPLHAVFAFAMLLTLTALLLSHKAWSFTPGAALYVQAACYDHDAALDMLRAKALDVQADTGKMFSAFEADGRCVFDEKGFGVMVKAPMEAAPFKSFRYQIFEAVRLSDGRTVYLFARIWSIDVTRPAAAL